MAAEDPAFVSQPSNHRPPQHTSELARKSGTSREGPYNAPSADGNPSFATMLKVAT